MLELVKPVEFVDEKDRLPEFRFLDDLFHFLYTDIDRAQGDERKVEVLSHEPSQARLPHARGAPEDHGRYLFLIEEDLQELAFTQKVLLTHKLFEPQRAHPVGKGLACLFA